ncbi:HEAT repeat domain-containing protein [Kitasatospora sp. NBC_00070]|uniref:HEAT repeat domain-containing protein n=1 Tax=Kitasatospora sp. NBC_00070 TaxID=2975962 RepID=UPI0038602C01
MRVAPQQLDAAATELLVGSPRVQHRLDVAENAAADVGVLARLAQDPEPRVRFVYAVTLVEDKRRVPAGVLEILAQDPEPKIRRIVSDRGRQPVAVPEPPLVLTAEQRVAHPDPAVRREAAADPEVPTALALRLAEDPENDVRLAVLMREDLSEGQRTRIPWVTGRSATPGCLPTNCSGGSSCRRRPRLPQAIRHCRWRSCTGCWTLPGRTE